VSIYTAGWIAWALMFAVIEGIALFNKSRGDTLSEHLWAWLGIRDDFWHKDRNPNYNQHRAKPVTPKWTLRLARTAFILLMAWLPVHILTGGWV
jgi:hypothetical protein